MRKNFLWIVLAINVILIPWLYWAGHPRLLHGASRPDTPELPVYGQMPFFRLIRENGDGFESRQMKGNFWIADFIFTRCPNQCPLMSGKFAYLQKSLPPGTRLASFSVDPEHDEPAILKKYGENFKADGKKWVFLTGEKETIHKIMNELHLGSPDDPGMHSLRFVLLDKELRVRGYYDSTDNASLEKIAVDVRQLQKGS